MPLLLLVEVLLNKSGLPVAGVGFSTKKVAKLNNAKKAETLFALNLTTTDGKAIDAKLFGKDKTVDDVNTSSILKKHFTKLVMELVEMLTLTTQSL